MLTGEQYLASLDDGRATYFEGERVHDLPGHPLLGPAARTVAGGYDWRATQAVDGRSPLATVPANPEELRHMVDVVHHAGMMAHVTYTSIMTLATAGPAACISVGRSTPSIPFAASSRSSSISAGSHAE